MIDERHEELAALYAFDLLEGPELAQFESTLARDAQLQALVRELRATSATLAHTAPATPPPVALKQRVLDSLSRRPQAAVAADNVIRPSFRVWSVVPWAAAACLALSAAWLGQRYIAASSEAATLRDRQELAEISLRSTQQQLEAERILTARRLQDAQAQLASATAELGQAQQQLTDREKLLADARSDIAQRDRLLADSRSQLAERERQVATLTQRVDALAGASIEVGRQLGDAKQQVARLTDELKSQGDLATLKITALTSMLKNSPQAVAVAVWDPKKQEGVLNVQNLPALAANEDYQLWVVDPQYPNPVDGGVFTVEPASGRARLPFKAKQPVTAINAFAVTRERKGGVPKAEGPFVLLGK